MGSNVLMIFAGTPTTIVLAGTSFVTTEPAPIITFVPIVTFGKIVALVPMLL